MRNVALLLVLVPTACGAAQAFVCLDSGECGADGVCEASGYCSFPDATCPSMRRYGTHAPDGIGGACVEPGLADSSSGAIADDGGSSTLAAGSSGSGVHESSEGGELGSTSGTPSDTTAPTTTGGEAESSTGTPDGPTQIGPVSIASDLDDGALALEGRDGMLMWFPSGEAPGLGYCGEFPAGAPYYAYLRFALPQAIPSDAVIDSAVLELFGHGTYYWDSGHALRVWAEHTPDAAQVAGAEAHPSLMGGAVLGDESVRWAAADDTGLDWLVPGPNASTDLAPLLQALVDDYGGLAEGAHVQLWVAEDVLDGEGSEVGWSDSIAGDETSPRLTVSLR